MPSMTAELAAEMRQEIREIFPRKAGWRITVMKNTMAAVKINIKEGPVFFGAHGESYGVSSIFCHDNYDTSCIYDLVLSLIDSIVRRRYVLREKNEYFASTPSFHYQIYIGSQSWRGFVPYKQIKGSSWNYDEAVNAFDLNTVRILLEES